MRLSNEFGKYQCVCNDGYRGSGKVCRDIDECKEGLHDCNSSFICLNMSPGYECIATTTSTSTTTTTTTTEYIDSCLLGHDCDINADCISIESEVHICVCNDGFRGSGKSCRDINECKEGSHDCNLDTSICNNLTPGFECISISTTTTSPVTTTNRTSTEPVEYDDFRGDEFDYEFFDYDDLNKNSGSDDATSGGDAEQFINACEIAHDCHVEASCIPTKSGKYDCECKGGFRGSGRECRDINECKENLHNCMPNEKCNNVDGNFECEIFAIKPVLNVPPRPDRREIFQNETITEYESYLDSYRIDFHFVYLILINIYKFFEKK